MDHWSRFTGFFKESCNQGDHQESLLERGLRLSDGIKNSVAVHPHPIIAILLEDDKKKHE
jgi:hypothetical protein